MVPWNSARTKVQLKLSVQRLRTLQEKKLALAKKSRREIADLLLKGRVETAKIRVEGLIQDDIHVELLELLELYTELLQARFGLLDASSGTEPEGSISDAVCSIVYAAPRTELKELQVLREMLMHKYGRTFSLSLQQSDNPPETVPARIRSKLALFTPAQELVDAYLYEIARGYGVNWVPEPPASTSAAKENGNEEASDGKDEADGDDKDDDDDGPGGGVGERVKEAIAVPEEKDTTKKEEIEPKSNSTAANSTPGPVPTVTKKLTPEEELAQRFERLKNLR